MVIFFDILLRSTYIFSYFAEIVEIFTRITIMYDHVSEHEVFYTVCLLKVSFMFLLCFFFRSFNANAMSPI